MQQLLAYIVTESVILPGTVAGLGTLLARVCFGVKRAVPLVAVAQLLGFGAAYVAVLGLPTLPPVAARDKVVAIAIVAAALSVSMLVIRRPMGLLRDLALGAPLVIVVWLAWPAIESPSAWLLAVVAIVVGMAVSLPFMTPRQRNPRLVGMLLTATVGLAVLAASGRGLALAQLSGGLAASVIGIALTSGPVGLVSASMFGAHATFLALAVTVAAYTDASWLALAILATVFAADWLAGWLTPRRWRRLEAGVFLLVCLALPALAIVVERVIATR